MMKTDHNPEHDSLVLKFDQLDGMLKRMMENSVAHPPTVRAAQAALSLLDMIRKMVLK